ncbi:MAG: STAS domain-containing protein [Dehalococcoidia bacterium]|nr:STAS domain-containing protein [Dehalococcoidia bacterium]
MEISEKQTGNVNVVSLCGRFDAYSCNNVEARLNLMIESSQVCLVVNLEGLEYISSSGLRVFLAALKKVRKQNGDIKPGRPGYHRLISPDRCTVQEVCQKDAPVLRNSPQNRQWLPSDAG